MKQHQKCCRHLTHPAVFHQKPGKTQQKGGIVTDFINFVIKFVKKMKGNITRFAIQPVHHNKSAIQRSDYNKREIITQKLSVTFFRITRRNLEHSFCHAFSPSCTKTVQYGILCSMCNNISTCLKISAGSALKRMEWEV